MTTEICISCLEEKCVSLFPERRGTGKFFRRRKCQVCVNQADYEKQKRWVEKNPKKARERYRNYELRNNEKRRLRWHTDPKYKELMRESARKYQKRNKELILQRARERNQTMRERVLTKYGGTCKHCGEQQMRFLCIDHVLDNGAEDRRVRGGTNGVYRYLDTNPISPEYQVLCFNCNSAKEFSKSKQG